MTKKLHGRLRAAPKPARPALLAVLLIFQIGLIGCGTRPPAPGIELGGVGKYSHLAFVPILADVVKVERNDGFRIEAMIHEVGQWETRAKAGRIALELLAPAGTKVTLIDDVTGLLPKDKEEPEWALHAWKRLKAAARLDNSGAVMLLRQNAVDARGRQYNPVADFMALGLVGILMGAAGQDDRFHPSFLVALNEGFHAVMMGPPLCNIGFDARILDAATGETLAAADAVLGQEKVPEGLAKKSWATMDDSDKRLVETYCIAALRRAIAQALNELEVTSRR